jgi:hypothetical protein
VLVLVSGSYDEAGRSAGQTLGEQPNSQDATDAPPISVMNLRRRAESFRDLILSLKEHANQDSIMPRGF